MEEFNLKATFKFIKRNFKVLAVTFVASAVVTAGITLLLPNYYKAQVVLLPSDTNSISKGVLSNMDNVCLLYTSPSPRDTALSRMPSSA